MINEGKAVFYISSDPTADSLHVGHFMALCLMKRLQMAGNRPIAPSSEAVPVWWVTPPAAPTCAP